MSILKIKRPSSVWGVFEKWNCIASARGAKVLSYDAEQNTFVWKPFRDVDHNKEVPYIYDTAPEYAGTNFKSVRYVRKYGGLKRLDDKTITIGTQSKSKKERIVEQLIMEKDFRILPVN